MWTVTKEFRFEGAHSLPHLPEGHKCRNLHGHSYKVAVECCGDLIPDRSWVVDYSEISAAVYPLIASLDHQNLNDVLGLPTTAENIAYWFWAKLHDAKFHVSAVHVYETPTTCATYRP